MTQKPVLLRLRLDALHSGGTCCIGSGGGMHCICGYDSKARGSVLHCLPLVEPPTEFSHPVGVSPPRSDRGNDAMAVRPRTRRIRAAARLAAVLVGAVAEVGGAAPRSNTPTLQRSNTLTLQHSLTVVALFYLPTHSNTQLRQIVRSILPTNTPTLCYVRSFAHQRSPRHPNSPTPPTPTLPH